MLARQVGIPDPDPHRQGNQRQRTDGRRTEREPTAGIHPHRGLLAHERRFAGIRPLLQGVGSRFVDTALESGFRRNVGYSDGGTTGNRHKIRAAGHAADHGPRRAGFHGLHGRPGRRDVARADILALFDSRSHRFGQDIRSRRPARRILAQTPHGDTGDRGWDFHPPSLPGKGRRVLEHVTHQGLHSRVRLERRHTGEHLVEHDSQRVEVHTMVDFRTFRLLRTQVDRRATDHPALRHGRIRRRELGDAEIEHLDDLSCMAIGHHEKVIRFDVPVPDLVDMGLRQGATGLDHELGSLFPRNCSIPVQACRQRFPGQQFHGEVHLPVRSDAEIKNGYRVGALQAGCGLRLLEKTFDVSRLLGDFLAQNFESHLPVQVLLLRPVHVAHPALADKLHDLVAIVERSAGQVVQLDDGQRAAALRTGFRLAGPLLVAPGAELLHNSPRQLTKWGSDRESRSPV